MAGVGMRMNCAPGQDLGRGVSEGKEGSGRGKEAGVRRGGCFICDMGWSDFHGENKNIRDV